mgnify:CR=1 FL=1
MHMGMGGGMKELRPGKIMPTAASQMNPLCCYFSGLKAVRLTSLAGNANWLPLQTSCPCSQRHT